MLFTWYIWAAVVAVSSGCLCLKAIVFERDVLYSSVTVILERDVTMKTCYLVKDGVYIQITWLAYRDAVQLAFAVHLLSPTAREQG